MNKKSGAVHAIANCRDCDWHYEHYKNTQALAAKHCIRTGHTVHVELGLSIIYSEGD